MQSRVRTVSLRMVQKETLSGLPLTGQRECYLSRDIGRRERDEGQEEDGVEKDGPGDNCQEIIEVCKEEVVQRVTITGDVTHVIEKDERLPEAI